MDVNIHKTAGTNENRGALSGGRQHTSGTGSADGGIGGHAGGRGVDARPRFNVDVPRNGYRWWYIDATSDDGQHGLTIIGFVGSVFSPYYFRARKHGEANPENHCAINVALYGKTRRWAMTERGSAQVNRTAEVFQVGPSSMTWKDDVLTIAVKERCMPVPFPLRGHIKLTAPNIYNSPVMLKAAGQHFWCAVAPHARVQVEFERPNISWSGAAYHDMNHGDEPLEKGFKHWTWQRSHATHATAVIYNVSRRDGSQLAFGRKFQDGSVTEYAVPDSHPLPPCRWGMSRAVASDAPPHLLSTLEDAPFYTRNHVEVTLDGKPREAFHESLSLDRFTHPLVQLMLPFRMPRRG